MEASLRAILLQAGAVDDHLQLGKVEWQLYMADINDFKKRLQAIVGFELHRRHTEDATYLFSLLRGSAAC